MSKEQFYSGQAWCKICKQIVNVYSQDNKKFECGFCGHIVFQKRKKYYIDNYGEIHCNKCYTLLKFTDCYEQMYCDNKKCKQFDKWILIEEHIGKEGIIS